LSVPMHFREWRRVEQLARQYAVNVRVEEPIESNSNEVRGFASRSLASSRWATSYEPLVIIPEAKIPFGFMPRRIQKARAPFCRRVEVPQLQRMIVSLPFFTAATISGKSSRSHLLELHVSRQVGIRMSP
jgi:hypothetical protein